MSALEDRLASFVAALRKSTTPEVRATAEALELTIAGEHECVHAMGLCYGPGTTAHDDSPVADLPEPFTPQDNIAHDRAVAVYNVWHRALEGPQRDWHFLTKQELERRWPELTTALDRL